MGLIKKENYVWLPIDKLVLCDWNYKEDDDEERQLMQKLINNIKRNGQIENIIVRELDTGFYEVVNGNHRLLAFQQLEVTEVYCYNLGAVSLDEAKRIAIETNETKFQSNKVKLAEIIKGLSIKFDDDDFLATAPYTKKEIDDFNDMLEFNWGDGEPEPELGQRNEDGEKFKKVVLDLPESVADQFNGQVDRFKGLLYPNDNLKDVSIVMPIEAMCQVLAQTDDRNILGG